MEKTNEIKSEPIVKAESFDYGEDKREISKAHHKNALFTLLLVVFGSGREP